jgi:Xaa-Pro aminopeptidase
MIAAMTDAGMEAAIVTSEINQRYLTGFAFTDGYVVVTPRKSWLITDFRYVEAAEAAVDATEFEVLTPHGMLKKIAELLHDAGVKTVALEEETLSIRDCERIKGALGDIAIRTDASALIDGLRLYKDEGEIALMQKAQDIADAAFTHILSYINPDRTEIDVALELEFFMRAHGAECVSFETIAVSGSASSMPHGVPRPVKLEKGFLTMDFGARVQGYCSDMTRTIVIGRADDDMRRLYNTVLEAQLASLAAAREGAGCKALDTIARDIIDNAGYKGAFGHSLGHGVGMYIHENPRLSQGATEDSVLKRGHVVTFEPGIYLSGKYGCRIEDMVAITPDGRVHNFTHSDKQLIEL